MRKWVSTSLMGFCAAATVYGRGDAMDGFHDALHFQNAAGTVSAQFSGLLDLEGYYNDQHPPGLVINGDQFFFNPRLALFLDAKLGDHVYVMAQARVDRGFDPGAKARDARLDEYFIRYTPFDVPVVNFQFGKFATVFGNWVPRHDTWSNPFITAPLPYENVNIVSDFVAPAGAFLARKKIPDNKLKWLPQIWGPSYATGGGISGGINGFDYAFELKNAGLSSRPYAWDASAVGFDHPTFTGRVAYGPNATWKVGTSFSHGAYLMDEVKASAPSLPAGRDYGDFNQTTVGVDGAWSHGHLEIWTEAMASRYQVPFVGNVEMISYYIESKYKFTTKLFGGVRFGQQYFDTIVNPAGGREKWGLDIWKVDFSLGYRWTRHFQTKVQYSIGHQAGPLQQGEQTVALQATLKF